MLNEKTYLEAIKYLMNYYSSFTLKQEQINLWLKELQGFSDKEFVAIIKSYTKNNEFAPQSPTSFIKEYKKMLLREKNPTEAFERFRAFMVSSNKNEPLKNHFDGLELELAKRYYSEMNGIYSDQVPFVRNKYVADYKENVEKAVEQELALKLSSGLLLE